MTTAPATSRSARYARTSALVAVSRPSKTHPKADRTKALLQMPLSECKNSAISMIDLNLRVLPDWHHDEHLSLTFDRDCRGHPKGIGPVSEVSEGGERDSAEPTATAGCCHAEGAESPRQICRHVIPKGLEQLVSIVHPHTVLRWVREERRNKSGYEPRGRRVDYNLTLATA